MIENSIAAAILLLFAAVLHMSEGFDGFIQERPIQNLTYFAIGIALAFSMISGFLKQNVSKTVDKPFHL